MICAGTYTEDMKKIYKIIH